MDEIRILLVEDEPKIANTLKKGSVKMAIGLILLMTG